jgi:hypothetical protein
MTILTDSGAFTGMVDLTRRVISRNIVGSHLQKVRKMDALV